MSNYERNITLVIQIILIGAIMVLSFCIAPGLAATISRSSDIESSLLAIWSMLGPSDAARNWLALFDIRATYAAALTSGISDTRRSSAHFA